MRQRITYEGSMAQIKRLILIMGDQLSPSISSLSDYNDSDMIIMCEVNQEATFVKHHKKKIAFILSAMRHYWEDIKAKNMNIHYVKMNDPDNSGTFKGEVKRLLKHYKCNILVVTEPSEYRVLRDLKTWEKALNIKLEIRPDDRFLCTHQEFEAWADGRKQLRMEYFYREMRKKYSILMENNNPVGGEWNYDSENRKPPKAGLSVPETYISEPDTITQEVMALVAEKFNTHFGDLDPFHFAVTREQALQALNQFILQRLALFGDYQDAMIEGEPWLFHAHLSFYINCGLLNPLECIKAAENAYHAQEIPLNAAEGFIRQILGWREYIRGIYWLKMPEYADLNFLNAQQKLPEFYWNANTKMNCMRQAVLETKKNAYAHHIQRLMVLGNFALLTGIDPQYVNEWFLIVYADAYEWVEMPNVTGMVLFADGGVVASKPYAAGGSYINKMSNYCKNCSYKVTKKNGLDACPFNYLYWNFLQSHRDKFANNPRIAMMYRTYDRMDDEKKQAIKQDASRFLTNMNAGECI
jgi:deoxyribodipyrimidine photolyase-related protein